MAPGFQDLLQYDVSELRGLIRANEYHSHTAGLGRGFLQTNIAILPEAFALDFFRFCQRNPKPCPLVGVSDTGDPMLGTLGGDLDIRTDAPAYNIYRDGELERSVNDLNDVWRDDLVAFALGCSFTFEAALQQAGIPVWHIDNDTTVPMFRSSIKNEPAGPFGGHVVVSMRAVDEDKVILAREISRGYPLAHGAPVHIGAPEEIGIVDVGQPDWGDPAPIHEGQVPVFWACGVTPVAAIEAAGVPFSITHKPGHMLITDIPDTAEIPVLSASSALSHAI